MGLQEGKRHLARHPGESSLWTSGGGRVPCSSQEGALLQARGLGEAQGTKFSRPSIQISPFQAASAPHFPPLPLELCSLSCSFTTVIIKPRGCCQHSLPQGHRAEGTERSCGVLLSPATYPGLSLSFSFFKASRALNKSQPALQSS